MRNGQHEWQLEICQQVHNYIDQLFYHLSYLYESNGINYAVAKYKDPVLKLLTPIQILSKANHVSAFKNESQNSNHDNRSGKKGQKFATKNNRNQKIPQNSRIPPLPTFIEPKHLNIQEQQYQLDISYPSNHSQFYLDPTIINAHQLGSYSKTSLSIEEEEAVCNLLRKQYDRNYSITKQNIVKAVRKVLRNANFKVSRGWMSRFFERNQDIRCMVEPSNRKWNDNVKTVKQSKVRKKKDQYQMAQKPQLSQQKSQCNQIEWQQISNQAQAMMTNNYVATQEFEDDDKKCEKLQTIVNRLSCAVRGHKQSMIYCNTQSNQQT